MVSAGGVEDLGGIEPFVELYRGDQITKTMSLFDALGDENDNEIAEAKGIVIVSADPLHHGIVRSSTQRLVLVKTFNSYPEEVMSLFKDTTQPLDDNDAGIVQRGIEEMMGFLPN